MEGALPRVAITVATTTRTPLKRRSETRFIRDAVVVAAGRGEMAERIIALAALNGVPVREDPDLMAMLEAIEVGAEIPPEAFAAVAEILVYLFRANATLGGQAARPQPEA